MTLRNLSPQWLKFIQSLGIEFWLPLPLLGLSFWFISGLLTQQTLTRSSNNAVELQALQPDYDSEIALIKVEIDPTKGISLVKITKRKQTYLYKYTQSNFVLDTIHIPTLEATISDRLNLPRKLVKKKMRYRWEE